MYQNQRQKQRVYTPQISFETAFILRRVAWALNKPMTQTLNSAVMAFIEKQNRVSICKACRDKRCRDCPLPAVFSGVADSAYRQFG